MSVRQDDSHRGHAVVKHREAVYQQLCAEILRNARDQNSLAHACARALGHPDVMNDATLAAQVRGYIAERESELRARLLEQQAEGDGEQPVRRIPAVAAQPARPTASQVVSGFDRLRFQFDERIARYDVSAAGDLLAQMAAMNQRYPGVITDETLSRCRGAFETTRATRDQYALQIDELARRAAAAARAGDQKTAAWVLRRLMAIHTLLPGLLPDRHLQELRDEITHGGEEHEHRQAARELIARERVVAAEINQLAAAIHRFHEVARQVPHDAEAYRQAEAAYQQAVRETRTHDAEWLADLMLELDSLLAELHDTSGKAEAQVSRFIDSVRTALIRMRHEIREIHGGGNRAGG